MEKIIIATVSKNNVIGNKGKIPWHSKEELNHFKETTSGFPVIMGRKTWETINNPLKNRLNIIISRNKSLWIFLDKVIVFNSPEESFEFCQNSGIEKVFIIGGGQIFHETINSADSIILSRMNFETDGDVFFPEINMEVWKELSKQKHTDFTVHYYIRK